MTTQGLGAVPAGERVSPAELREIGIFGDVPRTATAQARTRVEVLRISRDIFVNVIRGNPDAAIALIRILADRLAKTTAQLRKMAAETR